MKLYFNVPLRCPCAATGTTAQNQHITIAGLIGSETSDKLMEDLSAADKLSLTVQSPSGTTVPADAPSSWTQASGLLVLDLGAFGSHEPCTALIIKIKLKNGKTATVSPANVLVNVPALVQEGCASCVESCSMPVSIDNPANNDIAPMYVKQGSITATMCQTSAWPGHLNTLTVKLSPTITLYPATNKACTSKLLISGMDMACRAGLNGVGCFEGGAIPLTGADASKFSDPYFNYTCLGARSTQSGNLRLGVQTEIAAGTSVTFSFDIKNPLQAQSSPPIYISGEGVYLAPVLVRSCSTETIPDNGNYILDVVCIVR